MNRSQYFQLLPLILTISLLTGCGNFIKGEDDLLPLPLSQLSVLSDSGNPTVNVSNLRDKGVVHSGFLIGTANDNSGIVSVEISLDGGPYQPAEILSADWKKSSWKFKLPTGSATWRDGSAHTVAARSTDLSGNVSPVTTLNVRKGNNRDVNGDGYGDLAVGAYLYNASQGRAYVFHGSVAGTEGTASQTLSGVATDSRYGYSMAFGDANGDGYDDLAVGAYTYNTDQGYVNVYHGTGSGISATGGNSFYGTASGYRHGLAVAFGDANGDGFADLAIGAPSGNANQGISCIHYGSAMGPWTTIGTSHSGNTATEQFGWSLSMGDFNGDGLADYAAGSSAYNSNRGRINLYYSDGAIPASASYALTIDTSGERFGYVMSQ